MNEDTEKVLRAVTSALGHLRHAWKVGSLSEHDKGLVGHAIRDLESVTSGVKIVFPPSPKKLPPPLRPATKEAGDEEGSPWGW